MSSFVVNGPHSSSGRLELKHSFVWRSCYFSCRYTETSDGTRHEYRIHLAINWWCNFLGLPKWTTPALFSLEDWGLHLTEVSEQEDLATTVLQR
jgi:hypothetical protein